MPFRLPRHARLLRFPARDGVLLEGRLVPGDRSRGVALCHPHPLHGGSMLTPVILTVEQAFRQVGYTTLLFNFRGVGASAGTHDGGRGEVADVLGALDRVAAALLDPPGSEGPRGAPVRSSASGPEGPPRLAVAGYSFGSVVGGRAAVAEPRVAWYLGIAPPLAQHDFGFLRAARCPVALIGAARDEFSPPAGLASLAAALPGSPWLRLLDADHMFGDALAALAGACGDAIAWAEGRLAARVGPGGAWSGGRP